MVSYSFHPAEIIPRKWNKTKIYTQRSEDENWALVKFLRVTVSREANLVRNVDVTLGWQFPNSGHIDIRDASNNRFQASASGLAVWRGDSSVPHASDPIAARSWWHTTGTFGKVDAGTDGSGHLTACYSCWGFIWCCWDHAEKQYNSHHFGHGWCHFLMILFVALGTFWVMITDTADVGIYTEI